MARLVGRIWLGWSAGMQWAASFFRPGASVARSVNR